MTPYILCIVGVQWTSNSYHFEFSTFRDRHKIGAITLIHLFLFLTSSLNVRDFKEKNSIISGYMIS